MSNAVNVPNVFQKSPTDHLKNSGNVAENNRTALKLNNIAELLFSSLKE